MFFGYIDESGTPGVATSDKDFLVVSIVILSEAEREEVGKQFDELLAGSRISEIHFAHNSDRTKDRVISILSKIDFQCISVAIKKNGSRNFASYARIAELLSGELFSKFQDVRIEMDTNPRLFKALKMEFKERMKRVRLKQVRSSGNYPIQLADYVAGLSSHKAKGVNLTRYSKIAKKCIAFIQVE